MLKYAKFPLQNGLPTFSDPQIIQQSFRDATESNFSAERKIAEGSEQTLQLKEDFNQLLVQVSSLKKDLHHLMHQHIIPIQSSLPNASSSGVCCCYSENNIYPQFVLINDRPILNLQLIHQHHFCYRLYDSPSTSLSLSLLRPGSRKTSSPIPDSNTSNNTSITLPIYISSTCPLLQTGFEAPQPSPADSTPLLETPMLTDVSSASNEDSRGDVWGTSLSGGAKEDCV